MKKITKYYLITVSTVVIFFILLVYFYIYFLITLFDQSHFCKKEVSFKNNLNIEIDSIQLKIDKITTICNKTEDEFGELSFKNGCNFNTGESIAPYYTELTIFANDTTFLLKADSLQCIQRDGNQKYYLKNDVATLEYYK